MTEDRQAQLLARWLDAGPGEAVPDDLEPEVAEAVFALRPAMAPPPRVDLDDILGAVTAGPFSNPDAPASPEESAAAARLAARIDGAAPLAGEGEDEEDLALEAVYALRPDLAPPPRFDLDAVLGGLRTGPLQPMPSAIAEDRAPAGGPDAPPAPDGLLPLHASRRRASRWSAWGALAAAALVMVVALPASLSLYRGGMMEPPAEQAAGPFPAADALGSPSRESLPEMEGAPRRDVSASAKRARKEAKPSEPASPMQDSGDGWRQRQAPAGLEASQGWDGRSAGGAGSAGSIGGLERADKGSAREADASSAERRSDDVPLAGAVAVTAGPRAEPAAPPPPPAPAAQQPAASTLGIAELDDGVARDQDAQTIVATGRSFADDESAAARSSADLQSLPPVEAAPAAVASSRSQATASRGGGGRASSAAPASAPTLRAPAAAEVPQIEESEDVLAEGAKEKTVAKESKKPADNERSGADQALKDASALLGAGQRDAAIARLLPLLDSADPAVVGEAAIQIAALQLSAGRPELAQAALDRALAAGPSTVLRGRLLAMQRKVEEAQKAAVPAEP